MRSSLVNTQLPPRTRRLPRHVADRRGATPSPSSCPPPSRQASQWLQPWSLRSGRLALVLVAPPATAPIATAPPHLQRFPVRVSRCARRTRRTRERVDQTLLRRAAPLALLHRATCRTCSAHRTCELSSTSSTEPRIGTFPFSRGKKNGTNHMHCHLRTSLDWFSETSNSFSLSYCATGASLNTS